MKWSDEFGVTYREDTRDLAVMREIPTYKKLLPANGLSLLDLGGNIGAVACWWVRSGGSRVVTVEPEPENLALLRRNVERFPCIEVVPMAVTGATTRGETTLYVSRGQNQANHSTLSVRGRDAITVPTVPFSELMVSRRFDVVKVDIEGAEYGIADGLLSLPLSVSRMAIEYHLQQPGAREAADVLHRGLLAQGWRVVRGMKSRFDTTHWGAMKVYARNGAPGGSNG